ncbi:DOMON domain-containing protein [Chloropicon primus]|uniref:DOMON domain-containing protein n=2 Tax=Chloropicon primus TaxID=1764295 RepID=A0A5B8MHC2_9CHLO|nr:hypothetical protein A3770_03p23570 [Chloropicon primus]UPQ99049.1 DOMON domain-containing protein [Chloropicon primus]|eukprot:QDZ19839.1 hypothetical protein A3770_03p23570 [Chloropicon primus]
MFSPRLRAAALALAVVVATTSVVVHVGAQEGTSDGTSDGAFGCSKAANWEHVSPILCPVAKIRVCWNVTDERELLLRAEAAVTGYIQVGLMDRNLVGFVDVMTLYVDEQGEPHAIDQFIGGFASWTHADLVTDSRQDVEVVDGSVKTFDAPSSDGHSKGTYTSVTVKRKLVTGDVGRGNNLYSSPKDYIIERGTESGLIWMTSRSTKPTLEGGEVVVPTYGYKYPNGNKGTWRVTFDDSESQLTCVYYCRLQMNVCGDSQEKESQFTSEDECLARCTQYVSEGAWTLGDIVTDHSVHSLACRINAAHQAENAPAEDDALRQELCDNAGVSGNGVCGTHCENYCSHASQCNGMFQDKTQCLSTCDGGFVSSEDPAAKVMQDARYGSATFPFYDTAACRTIHASLAYDKFSTGVMPSFLLYGTYYRCPLASPNSSTCSNSTLPTCGYYCESVQTSCSGSRSQFANVQACKSWCEAELGAGLVKGDLTDVGGEYTLGCLSYLAQHATSDELCAAAKSGGSICPPPQNAKGSTSSNAPVPPTSNYREGSQGEGSYGSAVNQSGGDSSSSSKGGDLGVIIGAALGALGATMMAALIVRYRTKRQRVSAFGCMGINGPPAPREFVDLVKV